MYILIPVDSDNGLEAKITTFAELKTWALVEFEGGTSKSVQFYEDRTQCDVDWIDYVVLENKFENIMDFIGEGTMCLVRRDEETVNELVSAFAFKELDEISM